MDISIIVPLYNEEESLPELYDWIERVMKAHGFTYEVIFVNDGSTDRSWEVITELSRKSDSVRGIKFRRNYGKSPALYCGFEQAEGDVVITMDADLQDSPDEIPELYRMIKKDGYDLVSGYKQKRYDPLSKTIPTKLFNATARKISGIKNLHDFNCGLKAYRKTVVKNIEVYGEMHRYIPYLAKNAGFCKIGEKVVQHQARKYGTSKFGLNRFINGYLDLIIVDFISKIKIIGAFIKLMRGKINSIKQATAVKVKEVEFIPDDTDFVLQADGELYKNVPIKAKIITNKLKIYTAI